MIYLNEIEKELINFGKQFGLYPPNDVIVLIYSNYAHLTLENLLVTCRMLSGREWDVFPPFKEFSDVMSRFEIAEPENAPEDPADIEFWNGFRGRCSHLYVHKNNNIEASEDKQRTLAAIKRRREPNFKHLRYAEKGSK